MDEEVLIPIFFFMSTAFVCFFWFYYRHRARMEMQQTLRMALEKGNELSPEFIKQLGEAPQPKDKDLRRSLVWYAIAFGLVLIGFAVGRQDPDALSGLLAGAALPFTIGSAYLIMYRFGAKEES